MNDINNCSEEVVECPLCMEPLEVDDLNFYPCTCGYQICRFCWHRIRTDENELCPACRKEYPENPADFTPLTQEEMIAFKSQKRQRDQQRKQKITENRKHLANVRVVQKNLVFVVGLPPRLADADILKKHEYFGKYGKIHKVVINPSTTYAGVQGPSASAYVTYVNNSDALRAIQSVNNINIDGRLIKTSLGTTKYCSHFMKNQQCPKNDCMYLHELGDPEASFTKEEMHQGKHQEYEKRLHDVLLWNSNCGSAGTISLSHSLPVINASINSIKNNSNLIVSVSNCVATKSMNIPQSTSNGANPDSWPCLSISPSKDSNYNTPHNKTKKEKCKIERQRGEKNSKGKSRDIQINSNPTIDKNSMSTTSTFNCDISKLDATKCDNENALINVEEKLDIIGEKFEEKSNQKKKKGPLQMHSFTTGEDVKMTSKSENKGHVLEKHNSNNTDATGKIFETSVSNRENGPRSNSLSSSISDSNSTERDSTLSECSSGKSSPENENSVNESFTLPLNTEKKMSSVSEATFCCIEEKLNMSFHGKDGIWENPVQSTMKDPEISENMGNSTYDCNKIENLPLDNNGNESVMSNDLESILDTSDGLNKMTLNETHSLLSSPNADIFHSSPENKTSPLQLDCNFHNIGSHLPDLLNGVDGFQRNTQLTNDWEESFRNVLIRTSKHMEELQKQQTVQNQHQLQLQQHQDDFMRMQDVHKRNVLNNNIYQTPMIHNEFQHLPQNAFLTNGSSNRFIQNSMFQQPFQGQHTVLESPGSIRSSLDGAIFGENMSKFFDFHKNQQQQQQNQVSFQFGSSVSQHTLHTQRQGPKIEHGITNHKQNLQNFQQSQPCQHYQHQSRNGNPFSINTLGDDDLGFDPFIETQKGLAELMENELLQQQSNNVNTTNVASSIFQQQQQQRFLESMQRTRMPPPGFTHVNSFHNFPGIARIQSNNKIYPYMNMSVTNNSGASAGQHHQSSFLQTSPWNIQVNHYNQQHIAQKSTANDVPGMTSATNLKGPSNNNDWTAMDPAILSLRQFPTYSQNILAHHSQQEMYIQHLSQQQNSQGINIYQ